MVRRTNDEWIAALDQPGEAQTAALQDLREYLRRAVFVYLRDKRTDLTQFSLADLHEMAEDFAQDAMLAIQNNLNSFRGDARFTTWAYRFVINEAAAELRRRQFKHLSLEQLIDEGTAVLHNLRNTPTHDPSQTTARREFIDLLLNIIHHELNENQRIAILGVHFQGLSNQEVADLLETSPNTVYKTLYDARKKIKAHLIAAHLGLGDILALFEDVW